MRRNLKESPLMIRRNTAALLALFLVACSALRGSFPLVGERGTLEVSFTLTPEREPKVQELDIKPAPKP